MLTEAMPDKLQLMVTLASWCALRFGETVELRRGDIDLSDEVIRIRRAAVRTKGTYSITTPKSDAGVRDVAIPPHIIPMIEQHLAKHVGAGRDSLVFPADNGGICNRRRCTGTGTKHVTQLAATICAGTIFVILVLCSQQRQARRSLN